MCLPDCVCVCVPRWICLCAGFVWDRICSLLYCISCAPPPKAQPQRTPSPKQRTQAKHEKPQSCLGWGNKQALHIDLIDLSCVSCARELSMEETIEWGTKRKEERKRGRRESAGEQAAGAKTNTNIYTAKIVGNLQKMKAGATSGWAGLGLVDLADALSNWES